MQIFHGLSPGHFRTWRSHVRLVRRNHQPNELPLRVRLQHYAPNLIYSGMSILGGRLCNYDDVRACVRMAPDSYDAHASQSVGRKTKLWWFRVNLCFWFFKHVIAPRGRESFPNVTLTAILQPGKPVRTIITQTWCLSINSPTTFSSHTVHIHYLMSQHRIYSPSPPADDLFRLRQRRRCRPIDTLTHCVRVAAKASITRRHGRKTINAHAHTQIRLAASRLVPSPTTDARH